MSLKVEELYNKALSKIKEGYWEEGREIALKCVKQDPDFLGGWKIMFMYEVRNATLESEKVKARLDEIPFEMIESSVTEEKVRKFKVSFLKYINKFKK